jgi:hypothetical protein
LDEIEVSDEEAENEFVEAYDEDVMEEDDMEDFDDQLSGLSESDDETFEGNQDRVLPKMPKRSGRQPFVEIEYETEPNEKAAAN